ncbi:MAG: DUF1501 domain-containing protein [Bdellovibrionia bacterium]
MKINRRTFVAGTAGVISQVLIPRYNLFAQAPGQANDDFFVLIRVQGGMDVTLGLDPQVHLGTDQTDIFIEYSADQIFVQDTLKLAPAASPLIPYAKNLATINGVFMSTSDLGHQEGNRYSASGSARTTSMTLAQGLGFGLGTGPYGVLVSGATETTSATVVSRLDDVLNNRVSESATSAEVETFAERNDGKSAFTSAQKAFITASGVGLSVQQALEQFRREGTLAERHAMAAAFATGAARQAEIFISNFGLDSHQNHEGNHLGAQRQIWTSVADIFRTFTATPYKQGSLFDRTTFMVVGEFSRTPALNASRGKDHNNYTNSVLLAGRGINGAKSFGSSMVVGRNKGPNGASLHMAAPVDFVTGLRAKTRAGADLVRPENIARTISELFGNPVGLDVLSKTKIIPGVIKT